MTIQMKIFLDKNDNQLIVTMNKTNIVLSSGEEFDGFNINFNFSSETFKEVRDTIVDYANKIWTNFNPKEATSEGADYYEYYDRKFDNNGYLTIRDYELMCERPIQESLKLYQLNKRKAESLVFDLLKE